MSNYEIISFKEVTKGPMKLKLKWNKSRNGFIPFIFIFRQCDINQIGEFLPAKTNRDKFLFDANIYDRQQLYEND